MLRINAHSQRGAEREQNEDCLGIMKWRNHNEEADSVCMEIAFSDLPALFLLADGMGGHENGEIASKTAIDTISHEFDLTPNDFNVSSAVMEAHEALQSMPQASWRAMGTTIVGIYIGESEASIFNVGDSKAYRVRDNAIEQLSIDDVSAGTRNTNLLQCLGGGVKRPKAHLFDVAYRSGDIFVLLSDGVSDCLSDREILDTVSTASEKSACWLCDNAVKAGSGDDASAICITCT